jgi:DNA-binding Lrp family transcriptional regulator
VNLDPHDAMLLAALREDGHAPYTALAQAVGLSRTATRARLHRLLDEGLVRIVSVVHASVLGVHSFAHVSVDLEGPARPAAAGAAALPQAAFVSLTAGAHPLIVELRGHDDRALEQGMDAIRALPGVRGTNTVRYTRLVKDAYSLVEEPAPVELDATDHQLLRCLQADGRAPDARLAQQVGLSESATRARTRTMLDAGIVRVTGLASTPRAGLGGMCSFGATVTGSVEDVARAVAKLPGVVYLATVLGRVDLLGGIIGGSRAELLDHLDAIREVPGIRSTESWHHLDIIKEAYEAPSTDDGSVPT